MKITIPLAKILEFKEAMIFAVLGVLKLRGETASLSSFTEANKSHSSRIVYEK
jgi:anhydro-N-acetylmuramic acid kinase